MNTLRDFFSPNRAKARPSFQSTKRLTRGLKVGLLAFATILVPAESSAVWQSDASLLTNVIEAPQSYVKDLRTLPDGSGGLFLGWVEAPSPALAGLEENVRIQHLDADGNRLWGDGGLTVGPTGELNHLLGLASDGAGGLFVAWKHETTTFPVKFDLKLARVDVDGHAVWPATLALEAKVYPNEVRGSSVCADGKGGAYVCAVNSATMQLTLYHARADGNVNMEWPAYAGLPLGTSFYVAAQGLVPSLPATDGAANDVWVLGTLSPSFADWSIVAQRVSPAGVVGRNVILGDLQEFRGAVPDTAGGLWAVLSKQNGVYAQHVDGASSLQLGDTLLRSASSTSQSFPVGIVADANYGAIVVWEEWDIPSDTISLVAQKLSATGSRLWGANGYTLASGFKGTTPDRPQFHAVSDGAGGLIVLGERKPTSGGIVAYRVDAAHQPLWGADGVAVSTVTPGFQYQAVSDGASGVHGVVFNPELRSPVFAAQHVNLSGSLGSNSPAAKLINLSARARVGTGSSVLIAGFVVRGGPVKVLTRGVGPTLAEAPFNVAGVLADPFTELHSDVLLTQNDDWSSDIQASDTAALAALLGAFPLPNPSKDSSLVRILEPGNYTAVTRGADGGSGVAVQETYVQATGGGRLVNMSVRAEVGSGGDILIPGLVVGGSAARTLLFRAVGPTLGMAPFNVSGVLANPKISLFKKATLIGTNDNWGSGNASQVAAVAAKVGAFPLPDGSLDAALVVTLGTGDYTAQVSGADGGTGVCLVEVYEVP